MTYVLPTSLVDGLAVTLVAKRNERRAACREQGTRYELDFNQLISELWPHIEPNDHAQILGKAYELLK